MSSKRILVVVSLVVGVLAVGWFVFRDRPDPLVMRAIELGSQMAEEDADPQLFEAYTELLESFTPEQIADMEARKNAAYTKKLQSFFALSIEEQQAKLDAVIDEQDARRKKYREDLKKEKKTKVVAASLEQREPRERPTYTPSQLTPEEQELRTRYATALISRRLARNNLKMVRR
jgi:ParB-like chromosome segregation protein Spo0J